MWRDMPRARVMAGLAALMLSVTPGPVAASAPSPLAAQPRGAYAVIREGTKDTIVMAEWAGAHAARARLTLKASGLRAGKEYRLVGSTVSCGVSSPGSKRVFSVRFKAGARGAAWLAQVYVDLLGHRWSDLRSTRLMEEEGIFYACRSTTKFGEPAAAAQANGAIAILDAGSRHGIVILDHATDTTVRVRHDIQIGPDQHPRLVARSVACMQPSTTQSVLIAMLLPVRSHGQTFASADIEVENDETHVIGALGSLRVRDAGAPAWACVTPRLVRTETVDNNET
jgi:hypothetical protein